LMTGLTKEEIVVVTAEGIVDSGVAVVVAPDVIEGGREDVFVMTT
jgi:hypothetical protein